MFAASVGGGTQPAKASAGSVKVLEVQGVIDVASALFITREIESATHDDAPLVVLKIDTPGGLVSATRSIITAILGARVPVAAFVAPAGARAASAGTYIVYAAHIAAMAPGTHLGAATPVALGGPPVSPTEPNRERRPSSEPAEDPSGPSSPSERKAINDAAAYLRALAQLRGRNADFAEKAVREAATLTANEAHDANVIDPIATDVTDLLTKSNGRIVTVNGNEVPLQTKNAQIERVVPDWRMRAIGVITNPNVAYLLLLIGFYGLFFELWNPGMIFPGVIGGISLLLALAALAAMPVSYAGLALVLLGLALMTGEALTPGIGVLGIGGLIGFVVGSVFLFDPSDIPIEFGVALPVIAAAAATTAGFLLFVAGFALRARRKPVVTGTEELLGSSGRILEWKEQSGLVVVHGERWEARAAGPLAPGSRVRVRKLDGLRLFVEQESEVNSA